MQLNLNEYCYHFTRNDVKKYNLVLHKKNIDVRSIYMHYNPPKNFFSINKLSNLGAFLSWSSSYIIFIITIKPFERSKWLHKNRMVYHLDLLITFVLWVLISLMYPFMMSRVHCIIHSYSNVILHQIIR